MNTLLAGGGTTALPPSSALPPDGPRPRLDRSGLLAGVARRRQELAELEAALVADCEAAAARGRTPQVRMDDRATWDRATWDRYLAAAARIEPQYGPRMRQLLRDIDRLARLTDLAVAL